MVGSIVDCAGNELFSHLSYVYEVRNLLLLAFGKFGEAVEAIDLLG